MNKNFDCNVATLVLELCEQFDKWQQEFNPILKEVQHMGPALKTVIENTEHLTKLDNLENMSTTLSIMNNKMVDRLSGNNQWDGKVVNMLTYILGGVIFCLSFIVVFLLTGERLGLFKLIH